jgi:hypothetical protein
VVDESWLRVCREQPIVPVMARIVRINRTIAATKYVMFSERLVMMRRPLEENMTRVEDEDR